VIYRRTRAEMPAIKEEIDEALEEGIALNELVNPVRLRKDGNSAILTCTRMKLGEPDESGRPRPIPDTSPDALFDLPCERVILALGQSADLAVLPEGAEVRHEQALLGLTGAPVFLGGDLATNEGTVTAAIGSGKKAAWHIHRTLTGEDLFPTLPEQIATPEVMHTHVFSHVPRERVAHIPPEERRTSFTEVRLGLVDEPGHEAAVAEAERCFSCGVCNYCDRCVAHCPEGILVRDGDGYRFDYDYCKGCGLCVSQCPRGVNFMAEL
jgi:Pyruvate/2-oxoacid:ferredoxin oxidoreductase delta subunit